MHKRTKQEIRNDLYLFRHSRMKSTLMSPSYLADKTVCLTSWFPLHYMMKWGDLASSRTVAATALRCNCVSAVYQQGTLNSKTGRCGEPEHGSCRAVCWHISVPCSQEVTIFCPSECNVPCPPGYLVQSVYHQFASPQASGP